MKKQLTAILAVSLGLLSACAVEGDASEEQLDEDMIETTEQAFGEAACGTYTSTDSTDGRSRSSFGTCFVSHLSPDGTYGNSFTDPCKRGYYQEVQNLSLASTIVAKATIGESVPLLNCAEYHLRADVYATDTLGVTSKLGSIVQDGVVETTELGHRYCSGLGTGQVVFDRVQGGRTFAKARIVAQAYRSTTTALTYKRVKTTVDNAASPCP